MAINGPSTDADDDDDDGSGLLVKVIATFGEEDSNTLSNLSTNVWVGTVAAPRLGRSKNRTVSFPSVARRVYVLCAFNLMEQTYPSWTPNALEEDDAGLECDPLFFGFLVDVFAAAGASVVLIVLP